MDRALEIIHVVKTKKAFESKLTNIFISVHRDAEPTLMVLTRRFKHLGGRPLQGQAPRTTLARYLQEILGTLERTL